MKLSILIPTVEGREESFNRLLDKLRGQRKYIHDVEFVIFKDNKEISIGSKRDKLYSMAKGLFSVMIDDDDDVCDDFIEQILQAIDKGDCDCIGYFERCTINGIVQKSLISNQVKEWQTFSKPIGGITHRRSPFFKVPIKTEICKSVGVKDMRYAEDHDFAIRILPYLKKENFIYKEMYYYTANSLTKQQHEQRYGITK